MTETATKRKKVAKPVPPTNKLVSNPSYRKYITPEFVDEHDKTFREYIRYFRAYPDILVDYLAADNETFQLYYYQRLFLRGIFRYKYNYVTAMRGFGKSFLTILGLYLQCILYPGIKVFMCSGTKEQVTRIAKEKVNEIWEFIPALQQEVVGQDFKQRTKDYVELHFVNGSRLDIVAVKDSTRGGRRHRGLIDEVIMIDGQKLHDVVLPLMAIDRKAKDGHRDPTENHGAQTYLTTAGYKGTFAYDKLVQSLVWMTVKGNAFVWGGDFKIPVMHGLTSPDIEQELIEDGTYNPESFDREYRGRWSGAVEGAFFDAELFDRYRKVESHETEYTIPKYTNDFFYVIGVDVGRTIAQTAILVMKCIRIPVQGGYKKQLVNLYTYDGRHFADQAVELKKIARNFNPRIIAFDVKGLGRGLLDYMVKVSVDEYTEEVLPAYVPYNISGYENYSNKETVDNIFAIQGNPDTNAEIYTHILNQLNSGKVELLIDDKVAKDKLMGTEEGRSMDGERKAKYLRPYILTSVLKDEMMNMQQKHEGNLLKLERVNSNKTNDKFMAFGYSLWGAKEIEENWLKEKRKSRLTDFMFFN